MNNRRHFIKQATFISGGLFLAPGAVFSKSYRKVGLQLYTLREQLTRDVEGTIARIAQAGYKEIETFGYSAQKGFWGYSPRDFKSLLQRHGLKSPSGHYDFNAYFRTDGVEHLEPIIDAAQTLRQKYLTVPYVAAELRTDANSYRFLAARLSQAAKVARKAGLQLVYHNHDFEFIDLGGRNGFDILVSETSPLDLKFELDIYWAVKAGKDPAELIRQAPSRIILWHVKDMNPADRSYTEVGSGNINYKELFDLASTSGMKHFFVEQDVIKIDPFESITKSIAHLRENVL